MRKALPAPKAPSQSELSCLVTTIIGYDLNWGGGDFTPNLWKSVSKTLGKAQRLTRDFGRVSDKCDRLRYRTHVQLSQDALSAAVQRARA